MMERSATRPILATIQLSLAMLVGPLWLIYRVTTPAIGSAAADIVLVGFLVAWFFVAKAIIQRDNALNPTKHRDGKPMTIAHQLVDQSLLGVGIVTVQNAGSLAMVTAPRKLEPHELPPAKALFNFGPDVEAVEQPNVVPIAFRDEPDARVFDELTEYIVGRGDTFWSISEAVLGDGRDWAELRTLNLGREVAPGETLGENDELSIGWSILVPVVEIEEEN